LKKEETKWPIKYGDFLNYDHYDEHYPRPDGRNQYSFWSGYYTSRPAYKKHIKDASALFYSQSKLYARKVIDQDTSASELKEIMEGSNNLLD